MVKYYNAKAHQWSRKYFCLAVDPVNCIHCCLENNASVRGRILQCRLMRFRYQMELILPKYYARVTCGHERCRIDLIQLY